MSAPLSMASLGATALTEGIKFLYEQAGELLKRHRDRADADPADDLSVPESIAGLTSPDLDLLARSVGELEDLRSKLSGYVTSRMPIDVSDDYLLRTAEALRTLMGEIYGVPLSLPDESLDRVRIGTTEMKAHASGNARIYQAGGNQTIHEA